MSKIIYLLLLSLMTAGCSVNDNTTKETDSARLGTIPVELTTHKGEQQQFFEGDDIQFLVSLGQQAYLYMYHIDADEQITQILPHPKQRDHLYPAGYFLTIPEYEDIYRFKVGKPFGEESIWVIASDRSISPDSTHKSIETIRREIREASQQAYGEYVLTIRTRAITIQE